MSAAKHVDRVFLPSGDARVRRAPCGTLPAAAPTGPARPAPPRRGTPPCTAQEGLCGARHTRSHLVYPPAGSPPPPPLASPAVRKALLELTGDTNVCMDVHRGMSIEGRVIKVAP
jgi:hypothetical protein